MNVILDPAGAPEEWRAIGDGFAAEVEITVWSKPDVIQVRRDCRALSRLPDRAGVLRAPPSAIRALRRKMRVASGRRGDHVGGSRPSLRGSFSAAPVLLRKYREVLVQATGNASELRVRDLMTAPVYTLTAMQSLPLAESMMGLHHVRHVPVVDGDGRVVGLVTHRDLLSAKISSLAPLSEDERSELQLRVPVARIMRADVWTIGPDASAISAARIMQEHRFGCLPVVERERLVGIISEADLLALVTDSLSLERPVRGVHKEQEMKTESANESSRELVLVVAVDLSDVSEHLMSNARTILRSASEAELHVVHVVSREPFSQRITHPTHSMGASERAGSEAAQWELNRLCAAIADGCNAKVFTYTPIGEPAEEVIRVTREVGADLVLVETHHDKRLFHVSVATQIVQGAACSVLTLRRRPSQATAKPATPPEVRA